MMEDRGQAGVDERMLVERMLPKGHEPMLTVFVDPQIGAHLTVEAEARFGGEEQGWYAAVRCALAPSAPGGAQHIVVTGHAARGGRVLARVVGADAVSLAPGAQASAYVELVEPGERRPWRAVVSVAPEGGEGVGFWLRELAVEE